MSNHFSAQAFVMRRLKYSARSFLLVVSLLCLLSGITGIIFLQNQPQEQSFDIRQQASVPDVEEIEIFSPEANGTTPITATVSESIPIYVNTNNFENLELVLFMKTNSAQDLEIVETNPLFTVSQSEIEKTADGYALAVTVTKATSSEQITSNSVPLFDVSFLATQSDTIFISFDSEKTTATQNATKQTITAASFSHALNANDVAPTLSPNTRPTPSPTLIPTPTPSPTPTTDSRSTIRSCNETCSSNSECAVNHLCYNTGSDKRCRLATNPSNTSCSTPSDNGLNRQCNQYCANNGECSAGLSCWYNRCRRPDNIESTSCSAPSVAAQQTITQSCNSSCASNRDCSINMRCYNSQCRLASNPSSTSCSAVTTPTVSSEYDTKGDEETLEDATNSATVTPSPRIVSNTQQTLSTPAPTPTIENTSALQELRNYFSSNGSFLVKVLLAIGIGMLALFLLATLISALRRRKPPTPMPTQTPKPTQSPTPSPIPLRQGSEGTQQPTLTNTSPKPSQPKEDLKAPASTMLQAIPLRQSSEGTQQASPTPTLIQTPNPTPAPPQTTYHTLPTSRGSMLQRIKEKNVKLGN